MLERKDYTLIVNDNRLTFGLCLTEVQDPMVCRLELKQDPYSRTLLISPIEQLFHLYLYPGWNQVTARILPPYPSGSLGIRLDPAQVIEGPSCVTLAAQDPCELYLKLKVQCGFLAPRQGRVVGSIEQSLRPFTESELVLATLLMSEGWQVHSLPVGRQVGQRRADCVVKDPATHETFTVEFKRLVTGSTAIHLRRSVRHSLRGSGQARHILINAQASGLSQEEAGQGLQLIRTPAQGRLKSVRILGEDYDFSQAYPYRMPTAKDPVWVFTPESDSSHP